MKIRVARGIVTGIGLFILICLFWLGGSIYWYDCQIKRVCHAPTAVATAETPPPAPAPVVAKALALPEPVLVHFAFGKSQVDLSQDAQDGITSFAQKAQSFLPNGQVEITGHTDSIGDSAFNQELGTKRAEALAQLLASTGIPKENIQIHSQGEEAPIADNNTVAGRALNRRAVAIIKP